MYSNQIVFVYFRSYPSRPIAVPHFLNIITQTQFRRSIRESNDDFLCDSSWSGIKPDSWSPKMFYLNRLCERYVIDMLQQNTIGMYKMYWGINKHKHTGLYLELNSRIYQDSKMHGANMGPTWVLSAPDGPHIGPMNLAIRDECPQGVWDKPDQTHMMQIDQHQTTITRKNDISIVLMTTWMAITVVKFAIDVKWVSV